MKNPHPSTMYRPKGPCLEAMCGTCPFQPGGHGYGLGHPDLQPGGRIIESILAGLPFYCHETVLFDPRTRRDVEGPQEHWENCRGAVLFKRGKVELPEQFHLGKGAGRGREKPPPGSPLKFPGGGNGRRS